jgi:hypothetical protein
MKDIYKLTEAELHKISEIVTGYPCDNGWFGKLEHHTDEKLLTFTWYYTDEEDINYIVGIYIYENYDVFIFDLSSKRDVRVRNMVQYIEYAQSLDIGFIRRRKIQNII